MHFLTCTAYISAWVFLIYPENNEIPPRTIIFEKLPINVVRALNGLIIIKVFFSSHSKSILKMPNFMIVLMGGLFVLYQSMNHLIGTNKG